MSTDLIALAKAEAKAAREEGRTRGKAVVTYSAEAFDARVRELRAAYPDAGPYAVETVIYRLDRANISPGSMSRSWFRVTGAWPAGRNSGRAVPRAPRTAPVPAPSPFAGDAAAALYAALDGAAVPVPSAPAGPRPAAYGPPSVAFAEAAAA